MKRLAIGLAASLLLGCPSSTRDGVDRSTLPEAVRADYDVFAQRCTKCHTLARPLNSGITDDAYWASYVARMRLMPGSGISKEDETPILRFLRWYSGEQRKAKAGAQ